VKSFTSKAISTAATCFTALCVVFTSLSMTAPAAHAASSVQLSTNVKSFNKVHSGDLRIRVNADRGTGARVYINGKAAQFKKLGRDGEVLFTLGRQRFPDRKSAKVTVKTFRYGTVLAVHRFRAKDVPPKPKTTSGEKVVKVAKQQVGDRYKMGAAGPSSFDCSGLVQYSYKKATGKKLPHSSTAIRNKGKKIPKGKAKKGDVVWTPGHVAIYAGGNKVVEAANPKTGVVYRHIWQKNPTFLRM
jgi:cell wall-associated NlpC family hydrolase